MRYYTRAKELLKHLLGKFSGGNWGTGKFGKLRDKIRLDEFRDKIRLDGFRDKIRLDGFRDKIGSFRTEWWKEGVSRLNKSFDRHKFTRHKSFESLKDFDYEKFFNRIFSPQSYRTIHWSFLVIIVVIFAYSVGKMAAYIIIPQKKSVSHKTTIQFNQKFFGKDGRKGLEQISIADLFHTEDEKSPPKSTPVKRKEKVNLVCNDSDKKSSLPLRLINTIVLQNREKSLAAVQQESKKKVLYLREGDRMESISVKKISRLKVVFANHQTEQCEYIAGNNSKEEQFWKQRKPKIISASEGRKLLEDQKDEKVIKMGNTYQIKKEVKDDILNNINKILTQARAVEIKNPDGSLCFKMVDIVPGSAYSMLDIQNNDIICNINGKKIENLNSLFALFGKMRDIQNFEIVVNRDGQDIPMEYNFE